MKKIHYDGSNKSIKRIAEILNTKPEVGENHEDAYYGDYGKTAYLHSQLRSGNPHNVTAADLGLDGIGNRISLLESEYIALEARVEALERGQGGGGDDTPFIIKRKNGVLQYNTLYLNDVWAAYGYSYETPSRVEHIVNGDFLNGSGSIWRMNNGVIQPTGMDNKRGMTFTQPITLTTETTLNIRYSYNSSSTWRNFWATLWENVDPSTIQPGGNGAGFGTGDLLQIEEIVNHAKHPTQAPPTVKSVDVSALQGKTIWIHLFIIDVIPLITEIWFE